MKEEELRLYYDRRAPGYEEGYERDDAVFQTELAQMIEAARNKLADRRILEVACGTGYWTERVADVAAHVVGVDASSQMLKYARAKGLDPSKVKFYQGDVYELTSVRGAFDAGLACFWFSHVPRSRVDGFLNGFHSRLGKGSLVFMADNTFEEGRGGEFVKVDGIADTFKIRKLPDGSRHKVLKNYYDKTSLRKIFSPLTSNLTIHEGKWFWWVSYEVA